MHKEEIDNGSTLSDNIINNVISKTAPLEAVSSLHDITQDIVVHPRSLWGQNSKVLRVHLGDALERVDNINSTCKNRIISNLGLKGTPEDWVREVFSLIDNLEKTYTA